MKILNKLLSSLGLVKNRSEDEVVESVHPVPRKSSSLNDVLDTLNEEYFDKSRIEKISKKYPITLKLTGNSEKEIDDFLLLAASITLSIEDRKDGVYLSLIKGSLPRLRKIVNRM